MVAGAKRRRCRRKLGSSRMLTGTVLVTVLCSTSPHRVTHACRWPIARTCHAALSLSLAEGIDRLAAGRRAALPGRRLAVGTLALQRTEGRASGRLGLVAAGGGGS